LSDRGFAARPPIALGGPVVALDLDLADVDGDGDLDVVVITGPNAGGLGNVGSLLNDGSGGFGPPMNGAAGYFPNGVTAADFNSDGMIDVAISVFERGDAVAPGRVDIRFGDGTGTFGAVVSSQVVRHPYRLEPGDFDEDGDLDVAVATAPPNEPGTITVLFGDGAGGLSTPLVLETAPGLSYVIVADFTGDGHLDLAGSGSQFVPEWDASVSAVAVFPGSGAGTFGAPTLIYPQGNGNTFLPVAGDFDEDGRLDIAAAGTGPQSGALVTLFLSMCGNVADLALSIADSPDPVVSGRAVTYTITVINNGPDPASASVNFHLPRGSFVSATSTTGVCTPAEGPFIPPGRVVRCALGDLAAAAPGNVSTVTVVMAVFDAGTIEAAGEVVTTVLDPVPGNNTETETTLVAVPGGLDPTISAPQGATSITWTNGNAEAGYVVWRSANGVLTRFPAAGMLPANATSFVDASPVNGTFNCYRVIPSSADGTPLAASATVCQVPNTASPRGALADFRLRIDSSNTAILNWSPFSGHWGYIMQEQTDMGPSQSQLAPTETTFTRSLSRFTCFVLIPYRNGTALANSAMLCADLQ